MSERASERYRAPPERVSRDTSQRRETRSRRLAKRTPRWDDRSIRRSSRPCIFVRSCLENKQKKKKSPGTPEFAHPIDSFVSPTFRRPRFQRNLRNPPRRNVNRNIRRCCPGLETPKTRSCHFRARERTLRRSPNAPGHLDVTREKRGFTVLARARRVAKVGRTTRAWWNVSTGDVARALRRKHDGDARKPCSRRRLAAHATSATLGSLRFSSFLSARLAHRDVTANRRKPRRSGISIACAGAAEASRYRDAA